ncbi:MAG: hypothetical protein HYV39_03145 [Candidatus Levybacteria bacterium]|nr:hypothetical protein [Candidatus Levybacteria bacterium]
MALQTTAVLYLQRKGFYYYPSGIEGGCSFVFPVKAVRDLDVVNRGELDQAIQVFIDKNQLSPKAFIIVASESVVFEKDYLGIMEEQKQSVAQLFSESIPFENIIAKTFSIENGVKVIAINKDLCLALKEIFEAKKFTVEAISPSIVLGTTLKEEDTGLYPDSVHLLFEKYSFLKENGFTIDITKSSPTANPYYSKKTGDNQRNRKLIVLMGFLFLVVVMLIFMLLFPGN